MKILAGTSGYAFKEWKGKFYPAEIKDDGMLAFYASRFPTVEINNTFYRMPRESVLLDWATKVPAGFSFAVKASQRITHHARLKPECADLVGYLMKSTAVLGDRLGPILFQLPPNMKKDMDRLRAFLDLLPADRRSVVEFRHVSWFEDDVFTALRERGVAMCVAEQEEFKCPVVCTSAPRLLDAPHSAQELQRDNEERMNQVDRFCHATRALWPLGILALTACQATPQATVAQAPTPAATATAAAPSRHVPGMAHDSAMDADTRFMHHMIAHHAQALVMTSLVPARSTNQGLRLLAERIDISQKDEMALMHRWLERRGKPHPRPGEHGMHMTMPGMLSEADVARLAAATAGEFERLFLELMIRHHEGALTMVSELLGSQGAAQDSEIYRLASDIEADQRSEISRMRSMLSATAARPPG